MNLKNIYKYDMNNFGWLGLIAILVIVIIISKLNNL